MMSQQLFQYFLCSVCFIFNVTSLTSIFVKFCWCCSRELSQFWEKSRKTFQCYPNVISGTDVMTLIEIYENEYSVGEIFEEQFYLKQSFKLQGFTRFFPMFYENLWCFSEISRARFNGRFFIAKSADKFTNLQTSRSRQRENVL